MPPAISYAEYCERCKRRPSYATTEKGSPLGRPWALCQWCYNHIVHGAEDLSPPPASPIE